jgi:hypothetical protein
MLCLLALLRVPIKKRTTKKKKKKKKGQKVDISLSKLLVIFIGAAFVK